MMYIIYAVFPFRFLLGPRAESLYRDSREIELPVSFQESTVLCHRESVAN